MLILVFAVSLLPAIFMYRWLRKRKEADSEYRRICTAALKQGALRCVLLVVCFSAVLYVIRGILSLLGVGKVALALYYNFIVLALAEECAKYLSFRQLLKKNPYPYSQLNITMLMMIVGIGFELTESVVYAFGANAGMMLMRGLTAMHCGYGFIMGYFLGKGMKTGKKQYTVLGILLPFLIHGLYDACLSDALGEISEYFAYVSLGLAALALVTLIVSIVYIRKSEKKPEYTEPLQLESV